MAHDINITHALNLIYGRSPPYFPSHCFLYMRETCTLLRFFFLIPIIKKCTQSFFTHLAQSSIYTFSVVRSLAIICGLLLRNPAKMLTIITTLKTNSLFPHLRMPYIDAWFSQSALNWAWYLRSNQARPINYNPADSKLKRTILLTVVPRGSFVSSKGKARA